MPRDGAGAPAPRPLSLILRERRLAIIRKKQRRLGNERRRVTRLRTKNAELLLSAIVDGADLLAEVELAETPSRTYPVQGVALLVTMSIYEFRKLCELGAELEDLEDSPDAETTEADEGECALGWGTTAGSFTAEADEAEPSLGGLMMADQQRWAEGSGSGITGCGVGYDLEADPSYDEPSLGAPETTVTNHPSQRVPDDQVQWAMGGTRDLEETYEDEMHADDEPSLGWTEQSGVGYTGEPMTDGEPNLTPW